MNLENREPIKTVLINNELKSFYWFMPPSGEPKIPLRKESIRKIKLKDGSIKELKRESYNQVCTNELKRCVDALTTREKRITNAEKALKQANTPLKLAKAQEQLEVAKLWRDFTLKRLNLMLEFAKQNNIKSITGKQIYNPEAESNKILFKAVKSIKHLEKAKEDILLISKIKAKGSESNNAFIKLTTKYDWIIKSGSDTRLLQIETDDAKSLSLKGMWEAALRYNPTEFNSAFGTIAHDWVRRNVQLRTKANAKPGQTLIKQQVTSLVSSDDLLDLPDETSVTTASLRQNVYDTLLKLPEHYRKILCYKYYDNMTIQQIADTMSLPFYLTNKLLTEAYILLRKGLEKTDYE